MLFRTGLVRRTLCLTFDKDSMYVVQRCNVMTLHARRAKRLRGMARLWSNQGPSLSLRMTGVTQGTAVTQYTS